MSASRLNPAQVRALDTALRSAFPERGSLARMVRLWLGESLDEIVPPGSMKETIYNLMSWAESRDRMTELIQGALAENPTNGRLRILVAELGGTPVNSATKTTSPTRLQVLGGSKNSTVSVMLGLALLVSVVAGSSILAGWISRLPFPATATPVMIQVPTAAPSATLLPNTATGTPTSLVALTAPTGAMETPLPLLSPNSLPTEPPTSPVRPSPTPLPRIPTAPPTVFATLIPPPPSRTIVPRFTVPPMEGLTEG
ncbi:MAG: effector-associated domain EAD1-containing protein, partial [Chloroflexota bacterium]|nr:effector-associated domain EAD1-containing protein [Chloroflexota bacterium]